MTVAFQNLFAMDIFVFPTSPTSTQHATATATATATASSHDGTESPSIDVVHSGAPLGVVAIVTMVIFTLLVFVGMALMVVWIKSRYCKCFCC